MRVKDINIFAATNHSIDCGFQCDQYIQECTCSISEREEVKKLKERYAYTTDRTDL